MRRPTVRRKQPGVALFPFLAVLICTMGSLIVLLVLVVQQARAGVASRNTQATPEVDSEELRQLREQEEDLQWQAEMLQGVRDKNAESLAYKRLELSHLEDHIRRLEDDARKIAEQVKALQNSGRGGLADTSSAKQQLADMQGEIDDKKKQLDAARKDLLRRKPAYAIVPYDGPNGTSRRPMYIECTEDGIVLQPEGIRFSAEDFQGPMGPGNPLDAALRAIREHWKQGGLQGEPYPLIVVRPSGAVAFGAARSAMKHWESEFGYELVDDTTELKYPTPDPTLATTVNRAVRDARQRQAILAASMPNRFAGEARLTSFRAEDNAEPGDGDNGGSGGGSGYAGSRTGGGSGNGAGFGGGNALGSGNATRPVGLQSSGSGGTENFGSGGEGPYGLSQGGQYATLGVPGGTGRGGAGGSGNGTGGSGTATGNGGTAQTGRDSAQTAAGTGATRAGGSQAGQTGNGYASTKPTDQAAATGVRSQGPNGAANNGAAYAGGTSGGGSATGAKNYQGGSTTSGMGNTSRSGSPGGSSATSGTGSSSSSGSNGGSASSNDPSSMSSNSSTPSLDLSKPQAKASKSKKHRGENWGLPNSSPKATAVTRPIRIDCYADQLMLMPEKGELRTPLIVPIEEDLSQNLDAFVDAVWTHMSRWGIAVLGGYWKPVLLIEVKPGGEERFVELQQLLRGSGMEVQRRSP